jgi:hypothetical protein
MIFDSTQRILHLLVAPTANGKMDTSMMIRRIVLLIGWTIILRSPIIAVVESFSTSSSTAFLSSLSSRPPPSTKIIATGSAAALVVVGFPCATVIGQQSIRGDRRSTHHQEPPKRRFSTALQYGEGRGVDAQLLFDSWVSIRGVPAG